MPQIDPRLDGIQARYASNRKQINNYASRLKRQRSITFHAFPEKRVERAKLFGILRSISHPTKSVTRSLSGHGRLADVLGSELLQHGLDVIELLCSKTRSPSQDKT